MFNFGLLHRRIVLKDTLGAEPDGGQALTQGGPPCSVKRARWALPRLGHVRIVKDALEHCLELGLLFE